MMYHCIAGSEDLYLGCFDEPSFDSVKMCGSSTHFVIVIVVRIEGSSEKA